MAALSLTIDCSSLGLEPLQIGPGRAGLFTLADPDGVDEPDVRWRRKYAGDSPFIHGSTQISAVREKAELVHDVLIRATSSLELKVAKTRLVVSLSQFAFNATEEFDDEGAQMYSCDNGDLAWRRSKALRARHMAIASIVIPCHPFPATP